MSSQKRKASHPDIKQYFCNKAKEDVSVVSQPKKANICSSSCKNNFSAVQEEQHLTVSEVNDSKKSIQLSVSASGQLKKAFSNVTFQSWIKLKGFDESLNMNVFTLHADGGIICLLCSKHPVVNTGRGKNCNLFTYEPARPQRPSKLDNHISSDQHQNAISMEKINVLAVALYASGSHYK